MWAILEKRVWTVEHQMCNYAKTGEGHGVTKDEDDSVRIERLETNFNSLRMTVDANYRCAPDFDGYKLEMQARTDALNTLIDELKEEASHLSSKAELAMFQMTADQKNQDMSNYLKKQMDDVLIKVEEFGEKAGEGGKDGGGMTIMMPAQNPQPPCMSSGQGMTQGHSTGATTMVMMP